jgi:hypothetical protein
MDKNFISLFDYLGKPAGSDLGKRVFNFASLKKAPYKMREISNSKYTGKVVLYTREFLDEFFRLDITPDLDEILYKEENINN